MKKILPLLLLLSCLTGGQVNSQQLADKPAPPSNWKQLDLPSYSIQYPVDWDVSQGDKTGLVFTILAPLESKEDKFRENVNLVVEDLKGQNIDLGERILNTFTFKK